MTRRHMGAALTVGFCLAAAFFAFAKEKGDSQESERAVTQAEVPANALTALKKLAGDAPLTELAEETKHGQKFYEGSFQGPQGQVDVLVTEAGDVVEIEESMPTAKVPDAVRKAAEQRAGKGAAFERKTLYLYEIHYQQDGQEREGIFTADGRPYAEGNATGQAADK